MLSELHAQKILKSSSPFPPRLRQVNYRKLATPSTQRRQEILLTKVLALEEVEADYQKPLALLRQQTIEYLENPDTTAYEPGSKMCSNMVRGSQWSGMEI
jgi:hypothetical protein